MIKFCGPLSEQQKAKILNKLSKEERTVFGIFLPLICVAIFVFWMFFNFSILEIFPYLIAALIVSFIVCLSSPLFTKSARRLPIQTHITIENGIVKNELNGAKKSLQRVKKVLDDGDIYFIFKSGSAFSNAFVCPKNLLIVGSIAEFETLFQGKIIRKES